MSGGVHKGPDVLLRCVFLHTVPEVEHVMALGLVDAVGNCGSDVLFAVIECRVIQGESV